PALALAAYPSPALAAGPAPAPPPARPSVPRSERHFRTARVCESAVRTPDPGGGTAGVRNECLALGVGTVVGVTAARTGCGACLLTCPTHAIRPDARAVGPAALLVLHELCTGCLECIEICPADAIAETPATGEPQWT
ncbi:MAG: ATP-binding protein, partial [Pseudonocardia sp.]